VAVSGSELSPAGEQLLTLYDESVGEVYGYLLKRCRNRADAEDLTSLVFLAAAEATSRRPPPDVTVPWLIGIARHKLVDHWRRSEREQRRIHAVAEAEPAVPDDPWDVELDILVARDVLATLGALHRAVLTLRYVDGLSVAEVARNLDRTVHAVESLLTRAKREFRETYLSAADGTTRGEP
jgi:RNA polymerase sigma-70 factor (ECF subfamily)